MSQRARVLPVLQVITDNDRRGAQVFAADLGDALQRSGVAVRTVALAPATNSPGLGFETLGPSRKHPATLRALRRAMRTSSVVIGHGSTTLPMCAIAGVGLKTPFVYRQISDQVFWTNTWRRKATTRVALRMADHVVALWSGAAETTRERFGVDPSKISVIPNGVPLERCKPVTEATRRTAKLRFDLDPGRPVLLSIGALAPEKGVDSLIRAMAEPCLAGWQMLVVGAGPERDRLEQLAGASGCARVVFHAPVASGADAISAADVVGLTSRGGDSMPGVLIEAGLMGVPCVATSVEGIPEIVRDGRTGRLVRNHDPREVASAVTDANARGSEFGLGARVHCREQFEIGIVAAQWVELCARVDASLQPPILGTGGDAKRRLSGARRDANEDDGRA